MWLAEPNARSRAKRVRAQGPDPDPSQNDEGPGPLTRAFLRGAKGNRTPDLFHAMEALYQLSYSPEGAVTLASPVPLAESAPGARPWAEPDVKGRFRRGPRPRQTGAISARGARVHAW